MQQRRAGAKGVLVFRAGQQIFEDRYVGSRELNADPGSAAQIERCALTSGQRGAERRAVRHAEVDDHAGERSGAERRNTDADLELHLDTEHDAARTERDAGDAVDNALLDGELRRLEVLAVVTDRAVESPDAGGNQSRVVAGDGGLNAEGEFDLDIHRQTGSRRRRRDLKVRFDRRLDPDLLVVGRAARSTRLQADREPGDAGDLECTMRGLAVLD